MLKTISQDKKPDDVIVHPNPKYVPQIDGLLQKFYVMQDNEFFAGGPVALKISTIGSTLRYWDRVEPSKVNIDTNDAQYRVSLGIVNGGGYNARKSLETELLFIPHGMDGLAIADAEWNYIESNLQGLVQVYLNDQAHRGIIVPESILSCDTVCNINVNPIGANGE